MNRLFALALVLTIAACSGDADGKRTSDAKEADAKAGAPAQDTRVQVAEGAPAPANPSGPDGAPRASDAGDAARTGASGAPANGSAGRGGRPAGGAPAGGGAPGGAGGARGAGSVTLSATDVAPVGHGTLEQGVPITGNLDPLERIQVRARLEGDLTGLYAREGQHVRKGEVLARFENSEEETGQRSAEADLASAKNEQSNAQWNY
jgi:multidrug efflux pump subunit AcrA (membrane-fusion protein)